MSKKVKSGPKKKDVNKAKPTTGNALFDFLLNKAGGEEAASRELARERVAKMPKGTHLGVLLVTAAKEGWGDILDAMTLGDLRGPAPKASKAPRQPRGAAEETRKAVMKALNDALSPQSARSVADLTRLDVRKVGRALGDLVKAGAVNRTGSKRDSAYSKAS